MGSVILSAFAWALATAPILYGYQSTKGEWATVFRPGEAVTIVGDHFGRKPGTVTLGYRPWPVERWTNKKITIRAPEEPNPHPYIVDVRTAAGKHVGGMGFRVEPIQYLRAHDQWLLDRWNWSEPDSAVATETIEEVKRTLGALRMCRAAGFPEPSLCLLKQDLAAHAARVPEELRLDLWGDITHELGEWR